VRELRSALEQALLLAPGEEIGVADLFSNGDAPERVVAADVEGGVSFRDAKANAVTDFEREFVLRALRRNDGNISRAAEEIGMYRQNLQQKMRELGITVEDAVDSDG
jgi:DNA-binding NtrC family response regulator